MTSSAYLNSIKSGAIAGWHTHKIAPSITGSQAALESGWGTSSLAKPPYNNNFGIKASSDWSGRTVPMPTREWIDGQYVTVNASFRAYDSIADSVRDHAAFFTNTEWRTENYKHVVGERDYKKSARALQNAGYATDPSYATKLINIIEQYQLYKWDTEAYSGVSQPTESTRPVINPQPQSKVVGRELSNAGIEYVKSASISVIGDSLGVGTKPYLEQLIPNSNYDVVGSRQITHTQASLNATTALRNMLNAGTLKNTVIVIIGTNRGVTQQEIESFADIAGSSRKILFVDTASQVNHAPEVSRVYKNVASTRSNVFYVNWRDYALSSREAWYYADGAGGTYIHMNATGYRRHASYIAQAIYEADNSSFSQPGDVAIDTKTYYAHIGNLELGPDGIIEYEATSIDGKKKTFKKDLGVKGFYSPKGDMAIYNPEANEKWNNKHNDEFNANWIEAYFEESEIGLDVTLLERAVRYLDEHREPSAQYRIQLADIPQTLSIGDTGVFIDHDYNPPLYIEARVLELTTSRTNPSQNTVLIGNVVELQPQEKGWVHTMQQGLQQMRESLHNDWINRDELTVYIEPLNSKTLTESETSAYLSVKVMRGNIDVTEYFDRFEWERMSENEADDMAYNQILSETENSSTLEVTKDDLYNNEATFTVRVYDGGTLVEKSSITIKHVDTALWVDTDTPPTYAKDGATWVNPDGEQHVKVEGEWEKRVDQAKIFTVEQDISEAKEIADTAKQEAEDASVRSDEAKEEAGLAKTASESAESIAQQAQAEAESAKSSSGEALEKAILAGADAATAKQNALDAVSQVSTAKQDASSALGKASEAVIKANDAIGKANQIPQDIQNEIESKGLVSGSWVESHVDDVTGEINYALSEVSGSIPTVILGVLWDKSGNPELTRTDYVEEYTSLTDYLLKTNEIDFSIDGLDGRMSTVETDKLDGAEFTRFKTNDYDVTVNGFRAALTDKLDGETFNTFKTNEFEMTVDGIKGNIESLQTEKLDNSDFNTFKSNEYEVTVDGLRMDLTSVSGSIPTAIMGVRWDKAEDPTLYRTDDTGGVDDYEYSQQTAQFISDISGLSGRVESVETNKLGSDEFNSFKTNTYDVDLSGLRTNISSLDEGKLGSDEFSNFKTNVFDVSVNGLSGRIGTVETEKLDSETYNNFKTNTYDVDVGGLKSRMSSVESKKLDSGTFETFRDTTYSNTIDGINGSISTLQEDKLDNQDFNSFKQNEYEVTVDGLKMGLTDVQGSFPTIVLGVEWDKSSDPKLTRTDFSEVDNPNLYAPSFVMGVMWDKKESPAMYRTADTGGVGGYEFAALQADYEFTKENWSTRLSQIENTDYATKSWSNTTFATPQSVSTQLQSYAKTTDLNGMVTETALATKNYITAGSVNTLLTSYAKTGDVPTATQFNSLKNRYDSMEQIIGTDKESVARAVMTSSLWETEVADEIGEMSSTVSQLSGSWALSLKSGDDIVSQINLSGNTFLIEAKNIVGLGDAVIDGKLTVTGDMIADAISADKISGGTLTGTTFMTTESSTGFSTRLANGTIEFRHQIFSLGSINATVNASTETVNGFAVTQRPGYIFSLNSQSNLPGVNSSKPVVQVPAESTAEDRMLNIYAQGGLKLYSDTLDLDGEMIIAKKPLQITGLAASFSQSDAGAKIGDAGNLMYSIDKAGSIMIHRLMVRNKAGNWPNSGLALYEDGRVAVVVKGVWKQL